MGEKVAKPRFFSFCGSKAILSGPAGGVVGVAMTAYDQEKKQPIIGFDMGGTSTDVGEVVLIASFFLEAFYCFEIDLDFSLIYIYIHFD